MTGAPHSHRRPQSDYGRLPVCRPRYGLSLLETLLAIGLSVVVLLMIGSLLHLQFRALDVKRTSIEETQLARAVLAMITKDLRSVYYVPAADDTDLLSTSSTSVDDSTSNSANSDSASTSTTSTESDTQADAETAIVAAIKGIYGTPFEIQMDVHQIPRADQFYAYDDPNVGISADVLSGIKTISYSLQTEGSSQGIGVESTGLAMDTIASGDLTGNGLWRRVMDRAATSYAQQLGGDSSLESAARLLAPEVTALQFEYFDGTSWWEEWDSDLNGGLPLAVRVTIAVASVSIDEQQQDLIYGPLELNANDPGLSVNGDQVYRILVHIPTAEPIDVEARMSEAL